MSKHEWKPGDVAMVHGGERLMKLATHGWVDAEKDFRDPEEQYLRPLAVIDPEDREQVERLANAIWGYSGNLLDNFCSATEQGLREFASPTPPKPDEPTGLGAVVEDHRSMRFVRCADGWLFAEGVNEPGEYRNPLMWRELTGVRVLSEGVTE